MIRYKTYRLVNTADFQGLFDRLQLIKSDFHAIQSEGKKPITVVDFYVLYEACQSGGKDFFLRCLKYGYRSPLLGESSLLILPGHLHELEGFITQLKTTIGLLRADEIAKLREDPAVRNWRTSMDRYLAEPNDIHLYRIAIEHFNRAIGPNGGRETRSIFRRAAQFLFINKYRLGTIYAIMNEITGKIGKKFVNAKEIKESLGWSNFQADKQVYAAAFRSLPSRRGRHSNFIDARCHAICIELRRSMPSRQVRFFSSPAVVEHFFYNKSIPDNLPAIVRDPAYFAIERMVFEECQREYVRALGFVEDWIERLSKIICSDESATTREQMAIKGDARSFFGKKLSDLVNREHPENYSYAIYDTVGEPERDHMWRERALLHNWSDDIVKMIQYIDDVDSNANQFEHGKAERQEELDFIIRYLYDHLFNEQKLKEEYERLRKELEDLEKKVGRRGGNGLDCTPALDANFDDNASYWYENRNDLGLEDAIKRLMAGKGKGAVQDVCRPYCINAGAERRNMFLGMLETLLLRLGVISSSELSTGSWLKDPEGKSPLNR
jgi:hypothetical protein